MRLTAMITMAALIGTSAHGRQKSENIVTVYVSDNAGVSGLVKVRAEGLATTMFAKIGVRIDFQNGVPPVSATNGPLAIELTTHTRPDLMPGAYAYAKPFEGIHVQVFWDRIQDSETNTYVLAHVLVHEITHVLSGTNRHAENGVVKAHWTREDFAQMRHAPLPFTADDVAFIRQGIQIRNAPASFE